MFVLLHITASNLWYLECRSWQQLGYLERGKSAVDTILPKTSTLKHVNNSLRKTVDYQVNFGLQGDIILIKIMYSQLMCLLRQRHSLCNCHRALQYYATNVSSLIVMSNLNFSVRFVKSFILLY